MSKNVSMKENFLTIGRNTEMEIGRKETRFFMYKDKKGKTRFFELNKENIGF